MGLVPPSVAAQAGRLRLRRQGAERAAGALLHHVVEAVRLAVRQARHEGVLLRQRRQLARRVPVSRDGAGHLHGEFVRKAHHRQKLPAAGRQRLDHGGGEHGVDVRAAVRQGAALRQGLQPQIHGGEPALAGVQQVLHLLIRQLRAAAVGVDRQLRVVQAQLLPADAANPSAQPENLLRRQKAVAARHDKVYVLRQPSGQRTQESRHPPVTEQVKVVDEDVAGPRPGQRTAQAVRQQAGSGVVRRAVVVPQGREPRVVEGLLHAAPENGQIVGVDADADHRRVLRLGALGQIPVHRRGLAVAHGGHHSGQPAVGDGPQLLLQPLGYVDGVQPFLSGHAASSPRMVCRQPMSSSVSTCG